MPGPRKARRDAEANRQRLLAAAVTAMLRDGRNVPLATIAAEAGVGVGTLYRSYPDRDALLHALEYRAYGLLVELLDGVESTGLDAIRQFLLGSLAIGDQLVLPLHGAPPLATPPAVAARTSINRRLAAFIDAGRADGSIRAAVNATDIIVFSAIITQPPAHSPDWTHLARRQIALFLNGLTTGGPADLPGPPVDQAAVERVFREA